MDLVEYILAESDWLYTRIYQNRFFFFDLWSFVHLWSGFAIYLALRAMRPPRPFLILTGILFLYEVIEILFVYFAYMIFRPETIKDQFTDIILGLTGGLVCMAFLRALKDFYSVRPWVFRFLLAFIASSTYAWFWVGFYGYHYNIESYNTKGINISSLAGWIGGGLFVISLYVLLPVRNRILRIGFTWLGYFAALLAFEYYYYYILAVRETTGNPLKPLVFGLIHGTPTLHTFYMIAPFILIGAYELGLWLASRGARQRMA